MKALKNKITQKDSTYFQVKKKIAVLCMFVLMSTGVYSQTSIVAVGSSIYEVDHLGCTETLLCSGLLVNTGGGTTSSTITDIAYHPNGNLYAIMSNYFISIDIGTCTTTTIATHTTGSNALVAAADGTLYAASDDLYVVDINTGVFTSLGTLPCTSAGDLAFHEGELFLTCDNGDLMSVDINNPGNSSIVGNMGTGYWHGLWTIHTDCNNSQVLTASENEIYEIDLNTAATTLICTLGTSWIGGGTTIGDYNASDCGCSANLGPDQDLCNGDVTINAGAPNSTYIWQDGSTDSTLVVSAAGTYYVEVTDTIEACTSSDTIVIQDLFPPNAGSFGTITVCDMDAPFDLITVLGGTPDTTGSWSPALNSGTGIFDPSVDSDGTYTYTVTNSCGTAISDIIVDFKECGVGIDEYQIDVSIYPIPSHGIVTILLNKKVETKIVITDISGRIVNQNDYNSEDIQLDLSSFANGTYFISFLNKENSILLSKKIQILK